MIRFLLPVIVFACLLNSVASTGQNISKATLDSAIQTIAKLIDDNYVFPEKGKRIAEHLLQTNQNGIFNHVKDWKTFDSIITKSLKSFSNDGHLYVRYDPAMVKDLEEAPNKTNDSGAEIQLDYDPFYYGAEAARNNFGFREVRILEDNIGYVKLSEINISAKSLPVLYAAMDFTSNTKALIIDLSDNGGGGSELGPVFESFFLSRNVSLLEFRTRNGTSSIDKTVSWLIKERYTKPLFIIVNKRTASAAEAFAYILQHKGRATIIGQPSAGAANMNSWFFVNKQIYVSVSTAAPILPGTENHGNR